MEKQETLSPKGRKAKTRPPESTDPAVSSLLRAGLAGEEVELLELAVDYRVGVEAQPSV